MNKDEERVLRAARLAVKRTTGVDVRIHAGATAAFVELGANRGKRRFRAEVKTVDRFEIPAAVHARGKTGRQLPLLVAPYITREIAERCRHLHLPFIDTAG